MDKSLVQDSEDSVSSYLTLEDLDLFRTFHWLRISITGDLCFLSTRFQCLSPHTEHWSYEAHVLGLEITSKLSQ